MNAFRRVLHAQNLREAFTNVPDVFYDRAATVLIAYWLVAPLPLWWLGEAIGLDIGFIQWMNLQVGIGALVLGALVVGARLSGAGIAAARDPQRDNLPLLLFGVFLVLAVIASIVNPTYAGWAGEQYRRESIFAFMSYVGFFFVASQILARARRRLILALVVTLAFVTCVVTLWSALAEGWASGDWSVALRSIAYFHQFNHYGYLLAVASALAASGALVAHRRTVRWILLALFGVTQITLILNDTLGAYIAMMAGCVLVVVWMALIRRLRARRVVAVIAVVLAVHVLAEILGAGTLAEFGSLSDDVQAVSAGAADAASAGTGRWGLWMTTLEQISTSPWLGHGIEGIADLLPHGFGRPHNEYLQYAVFFGIPALIAYLGAVSVVFVRLARRGRAVDEVTVCAAAGAGVYLLSACFGNTMYYTAPLLFLLLGIAWAGVRAPGIRGGTQERMEQTKSPLGG
ncbi:O-antigen ligase family protein [Microbacterium sp. W1N]|uniref:O-antigen ligase family protein n=1 Tax=Microbacterium festucae TaxID=2977531 RepID=UPI0021C0B297|nr:O-antigen ligase family protein [Microbacterium festucae]MCT9821605.1 O-antigen ligase family protein [Microbacterium festucae]